MIFWSLDMSKILCKKLCHFCQFLFFFLNVTGGLYLASTVLITITGVIMSYKVWGIFFFFCKGVFSHLLSNWAAALNWHVAENIASSLPMIGSPRVVQYFRETGNDLAIHFKPSQSLWNDMFKLLAVAVMCYFDWFSSTWTETSDCEGLLCVSVCLFVYERAQCVSRCVLGQECVWQCFICSDWQYSADFSAFLAFLGVWRISAAGESLIENEWGTERGQVTER